MIPFLQAIEAQLGPQAAVTRFAPSPTGYLHIGHVAHMIYVWGIAQALGGTVLLRIEDHDAGRCRPEYEQAILEDIDWLGFEPDNQLEGISPYRQSDCPAVYFAALARLQKEREVYCCTCSRKDIAGRSPAGDAGENRYDGWCRRLGHSEDTLHGLRVVMKPGPERFTDAYLGPQQQTPADQCGDLLLRDRHSQWTYQLAVTVDDMRHGVNLVIRGEDLLSSTGRQIRLARLLGRESPLVFAHHPLITDRRGEKLSKTQFAPAVRDLRAQGVPAHEVLGRAAFDVGLLSQPRPLTPPEAAEIVVP